MEDIVKNKIIATQQSRWWVLMTVLVLLGGCGRQTTFPNQPITLICPWSAGGGTDRVSRQIATQLEEQLGIPVNVINATGGSGVTGHTRGARARPDGHTLTMITVELSMLHWRDLTSVTFRDFAPLQLLNRDSAALFVRGDSPWTSLNQLQAEIEARPGALKASGTAYGGIWHVALAGWLNARSVDPTVINWISINGAGPSLQELNAGGVDMVCCSLPEADALLAGGRVRCLGLMADERLAGFEEVPTFKEQGHEWSLAGWRGMAAPRDTPPERLAVLEQAMDVIGKSQALEEFMNSAGFKLDLAGPESFAETLAQQDEEFREILTSAAFSSMSGEHFGPMIFPGTIAALLIVALGCVAWKHRQSAAPTESVASATNDSAQPVISQPATTRPAVVNFGPAASLAPTASLAPATSLAPAVSVVVAAAFYILAAEWLGFVITAALVVGGLLAAFHVRWSVAVVLACATSPIVYQAFAIGLRVPLPRGLLGW